MGVKLKWSFLIWGGMSEKTKNKKQKTKNKKQTRKIC
jgi:hypothetical protein